MAAHGWDTRPPQLMLANHSFWPVYIHHFPVLAEIVGHRGKCVCALYYSGTMRLYHRIFSNYGTGTGVGPLGV